MPPRPRSFDIAAFDTVAFTLACAGVALLLAVLFLSILRINQGAFTYTLDDPYIDLALGDQIRHGNYGIQDGLHASPSSSILFALLLAPAAASRLYLYLPLVLNIFGLFLAMEIMRRYLRHLRLAQNHFGSAICAATIALLALCFNLIGVVFTGLEHNLHIAAMLAIIYGLALFLDTDRIPRWLPAVTILAPLLRYESLPLCLAVLLVFTLRGRWRTAAATLAIIVISLAAYSLFLIKLGLPALPSSILIKSLVAAQGMGAPGLGILKALIANVGTMAEHNTGMLLLILGVVAAVLCVREIISRPPRWSSQGLMAFVLLCLIAGHALAGRFGWFERYEDYVLISAALIAIYLSQQSIRATLADPARRRILIPAAAAILLIVGARYCRATFQVPVAANNVYEQQFQMHRFVSDFYQAPVAVNDVGLVSFRNPYYVLDVFGLTSETARHLRSRDAGPAAYQSLLGKHDVHLAMIYEAWFAGRIPAQWQKVAEMTLSRPQISVAEDNVAFFATDEPTAMKVRQQLQAFREKLPPGVTLDIY